ncbi:MAG TPA: BatD family protein [Rhodanobacter sp.]
MTQRFFRGWLLLLLLVPAMVRAADVQATLDRSRVQLGETVTLNLRLAGAGSNISMPDLSVLNQDFEILGTSQNSSLSIVNGSATSELTFSVALRPKHVGVLQIPALDINGGRTAPLQVQVSAADPAAAAATHKDVFVEAQVEPGHGYVGQQLSYVLRLFYAVNLSNGSLDQPAVNGVEMSQVGGDVTYTAQRDGRTYEVRERRFALIPQHAGHIGIDAASFQGEAVDPNDPNSFFGAGTPVSVSAPPVAIDVKPAPADWGSSAWLPARQLTLTLDGWPGANEPPRVGQPLNLTMNLQATGLAYDSLPALSFPPVDGATVYPDKPAMGNHVDGPWIVGRRQQSFAVVPERAGTLSIPATTLKWWNVQADRMETAQIPARSVTVLPAVGGASQPSAPAGVPSVRAAAGPTAVSVAARATPWLWIAIGSLGLWLLSMLVWLLWRRRPSSSKPGRSARQPRTSEPRSARQLQRDFLDSVRGDDTTAQARSLLAWARAERPAIHNLGQLSAALGDEQQRAVIALLEQHRYAAAPAVGDRSQFAGAFKQGFAWRVADAGDDNPDLPPLYPFKLR